MNVRTFPLMSLCLAWIVSVTPSLFRMIARKTRYAIGALFVLSGSLHAEGTPAAEDLVNTIWATESGYSYVAVTTDGTVASFDGANFYIKFLEVRQGVLVAQARWFSPKEQLGETQYLLFAPDGVGGYSFQAAGALEVVGGASNGNMHPADDGTALFTSFNLENDRAGSINTILTKVDTLPAKFEAGE